MIFGDEKLFDGTPGECFCVAKNAYGDRIFYKAEYGALFWLDNNEWKPLWVMSGTPLAMRRIIKTQVIGYDESEFEDEFEALYWHFDTDKKTGARSERDIFKGKVRYLINKFTQPKKTPVWTVADQKEERLPEVGAEVMCMDDSRHNFVGESIHAEHWALCHSKTKKVFHIPATAVRPVETDTERQQRLKEEWCSNALDSASILSGMQEYELKRLGGYIGNIYDALLSGELTAPKGGELCTR